MEQIFLMKKYKNIYNNILKNKKKINFILWQI